MRVATPRPDASKEKPILAWRTAGTKGYAAPEQRHPQPVVPIGPYTDLYSFGRTCYDAVRHALDLGYRHIDTAQMYGNQDAVGAALAASGVRRAEIHLTSKGHHTIQSPAEFRAAFEEKFEIDLTDRPTMITVRGRCWEKDGSIHTDSVTKLITVLIYMNSSWEDSGGQLRLLRSGEDLEDYVAEVPPEEGTLIAFRRSDHSWHGHKPFVGPRRVIQLNWVTSQGVLRYETRRHRYSAFLKRLFRRAS